MRFGLLTRLDISPGIELRKVKEIEKGAFLAPFLRFMLLLGKVLLTF